MSRRLSADLYKIIIIIVGVGLLFLFFHGRAEVKKSARLLKEADRLAWLGNWERAAPLYTEAGELFTQEGDTKNALHAKFGWIRSQMQIRSLQELSELLSKELQNQMVQDDSRLRLRCLVSKAEIDMQFDLLSSQKAWQQALALAESLSDKSVKRRATGELGILAYLVDGDSSKAQKMVATALFSAMASGDSAAQIRYLAMIGNAMSQFGRYEVALAFYDRAVSLAHGSRDIPFPHTATVGKARTLIAMNQRADAKKLFYEALESARSMKQHGYETEALILLANLSNTENDDHAAMGYLERAIVLATEGRFHRSLADATFELSQLYRKRGDLPKAEEHLARSIHEMRETVDKYDLPHRLIALAGLKASRSHVTEADAVYEEATDVVEGMLVNVATLQAKSSLVGAMSKIYLDHFTLAVEQLQDVKKAFRILERARGRSSAESLRSHASVSTEQRPGKSDVEKEIDNIQILLTRAEKPAERKQLLARLLETEQRLAPIMAERSSSRSGVLEKPVELSKLQGSLSSQELLLEYVLNEPTSFCLAATRDSIRLIRLAGRKRIEDLVERHLAELKSKKSGFESGRELYSLLLEPVLEAIAKSRWIVVPDGKLHLLPFDALVNTGGEYVLDSHSVTYSPSATFLHQLRISSPVQPTQMALLGVGDVPYGRAQEFLMVKNTNSTKSEEESVTRGLYDVEGAKLQPLPNTRKEVVTAAEVSGKNSVLLLGKEATEAAFKSQPLSSFKILHLSVHAIANTQFPDRAALVLAPDSSSQEDGLLQAREISSLHLNADLVILSACDTGVGRLQGQDGVANLVRSFFFAGAKTVVASLWSSDDRFTTSLMKQFYSHLAKGEDKGSALWSAKRDLIKTFGHEVVPFHWAGFTMVGEASLPISFSSR